MSDRQDMPAAPEGGVVGDAHDADRLSPLPGEAGIPDVSRRRRWTLSRKGLLAAGLLTLLLAVGCGFTFAHVASRGRKPDENDPKRLADQPAAATSEPRKLDLSSARPTASAATATAAESTPVAVTRIPALTVTAEEAEAIAVRPTASTGSAGSAKVVRPEDAPVLLVAARPTNATPSQQRETGANPSAAADQASSDPNDPQGVTARNLEAYQQRLRGLMDTLTRSTALATQNAVSQPTGAGATQTPLGSLLGGAAPQLHGEAGSRSSSAISASMLGNRSLTLPKGTAFTCALKTRVVSATSGLIGCQVQRNVFSDDGRVVLIERGSHVDGEYHIASVKPGTVRIPVVWTRIRTPNGVVVDIDAPGTGPLGEAGIDGYVDNRWGERIGAALLLSLIDDSVKLVIQNQANDRQGDTIVLPSTTANTSKLAEKVLDSTINIPPLIYQNQGGIVGVYVKRDIDFSSVYALQPSPR